MNAEEQAEIRSRICSLDDTGAAGLRDWTAIRVHLKRHDDEMIGDYEDDINTMLVFAGLFSAVVTAFIIDSYKWLQQDNSQTTIQLLAKISSQLANLNLTPAVKSLSDLAVNSIPPLAVATPTFVVSASSIWINCLWVLSLLFSLTAALLGIIIKQWLREYLLWDSVLFPSREAVLLRHIRYDAWERWKVPVIISAIPAMLELALVLFLCGAATLLWTLNAVVAIVVTVFGSLAFIAACAVNILPVFFHRCPYKSAVGWTFVSAWNIARRWTKKGLWRLNRKFHFRDARKYGPKRSESWRQRDLERNMHWGMPIRWELHPEVDKNTQLETVELVILFHALAWVCSSTQDDRLLAKVQQCAGNFHGTSGKHACLVAGMHAVCQIFGLDSGKFFKTIRSEFYNQSKFIVAGKESGALSEYGTYTLNSGIDNDNDNDIWQSRPPDQAILQMVADVLLNILQICVDDMFPPHPSPLPTTSAPPPEQLEALVESLCFLVHVSRRASQTWRDNFVGVMQQFWDGIRNAEYGGPWMLGENAGQRMRYPGLKATLFQVMKRLGTVHIVDRGDVIVHRHEVAPTGHYAELAMRVYDTNPAYKKPEDRHLFVVAANDAVLDVLADHRVPWPSHPHPAAARTTLNEAEKIVLHDLFICMEEALQSAAKLQLKNGGFYGNLPWVDTLWRFVAAVDDDGRSLVPLTLVDKLQESCRAELIGGPSVVRKLTDLRTLLLNSPTAPSDTPPGHGHTKDISGSSTRSRRTPRSPHPATPVIVDSPEQSYFSPRSPVSPRFRFPSGPRFPAPVPKPVLAVVSDYAGDRTDADKDEDDNTTVTSHAVVGYEGHAQEPSRSSSTQLLMPSFHRASASFPRPRTPSDARPRSPSDARPRTPSSAPRPRTPSDSLHPRQRPPTHHPTTGIELPHPTDRFRASDVDPTPIHIPFPTPVTPSNSSQFVHHSRGSTWPN